jgi:tetratricopeptide (TPR) repeat protein
MSTADLRITAATFLSVFPHASLWINPSGSDVFFVGGRAPVKLDYGRVTDLLGTSGIAQDLARGNVDGPLTLAGLFVMDEGSLARFANGAPLHTDDRPRLDYSAPRSLYTANVAANVAALNEQQTDVTRILRVTDGQTWPSEFAFRADVERVVGSRQIAARGLAKVFAGEGKAALADYREAAALDPHNASARTLIAMTYLLSANEASLDGNLTEAVDLLVQGVAARPEFVPARRALASTYARLGRLQDAVAQLDALLQISPDDALGLGDHGLYLYRLGQTRKAEQDLRRAIELDPSLYVVRNVLASLYVNDGRSSEARREFTLSLNTNPDQPKVQEALRQLPESH